MSGSITEGERNKILLRLKKCALTAYGPNYEINFKALWRAWDDLPECRGTPCPTPNEVIALLDRMDEETRRMSRIEITPTP